jgi:hypothetical protein
MSEQLAAQRRRRLIPGAIQRALDRRRMGPTERAELARQAEAMKALSRPLGPRSPVRWTNQLNPNDPKDREAIRRRAAIDWKRAHPDAGVRDRARYAVRNRWGS